MTSKSDEFKILNDRDHCLNSPYMFIGSTSNEQITGMFNGELRQTLEIVPGLIKIINEVLDNSIDEYIRTKGKFGNRIDITVDNGTPVVPECIVMVKDNGRGIPVDKVDGIYRPVAAWTHARAGTNFSEERSTIGAHGYGAYLTNVFSNWFIGETFDGTTHLKLHCENNAEKIKHLKTSKNKSGSTYTKVEFAPSLSILGGLSAITDDHVLAIKDRLNNLAVCFPGIQFSLNGEKIKFKSLKDYASSFSEHYVSYDDDDNILILANSGKEEEFLCLSYVNGLHIKSGGSHIEYIMSSLIDHLRPMAEKKFKIEVKPSHIRQHLMCVNIIRNMQNLKFDSQTKDRITNPWGDIKSHIVIDFEKLAKKILNTPEIIDPIVEMIIYKKEMADRLALARKQKGIKKKRVLKHVRAMAPNPADRLLLVSEGDSASGRIASVRDPNKVGSYPLRGKILNTRGIKPSRMIENKEIGELMAILGLELGKPAVNITYGKIAIFTDADTDGSAIACLLVNFFSMWPELFAEKKIYRAITPLFISTKKSDRKYFYTHEEYRNANLGSGWETDYVKGLGSLPKDVYSEMVNEPRLVEIKFDDSSMESLEMAFGNDTQLRKDWLLA